MKYKVYKLLMKTYVHLYSIFSLGNIMILCL
ncbi:hypothetical protein F383_19131 [Gossypium arboreum]|uniref:Uncharacterized protein n=1 Tax=Gossypium arboreum TaxID=29729 RepID=A0A0B0NRI9_GOSAR|nr:hypothetical protein F383_19131 [Gossypium arboreum]